MASLTATRSSLLFALPLVLTLSACSDQPIAEAAAIDGEALAQNNVTGETAATALPAAKSGPSPLLPTKVKVPVLAPRWVR